MNDDQIESMLGHNIVSITGGVGDYVMSFTSSDGVKFVFWHEQDCCEEVRIEEVVGDLNDLLYSTIMLAEEVSSEGHPDPNDGSDTPESHTWTFYKFGTLKGYVTVRWFGTSNGYYSEGVSFRMEKA